jgi:hypothetical protein
VVSSHDISSLWRFTQVLPMIEPMPINTSFSIGQCRNAAMVSLRSSRGMLPSTLMLSKTRISEANSEMKRRRDKWAFMRRSVIVGVKIKADGELTLGLSWG